MEERRSDIILNNLSLGIALLIFVLFGLPCLFLSIARRRESNASGFYILLCVSNALWGIFHALFFLLPGQGAALLAYDLRLIFMGYSSVFTFLFTLQSLQRFTISKSGMFSLLAIPAVTGALVLVDRWVRLIRTSITILQPGAVRMVQSTHGLWFWVHSLSCYICLAVAAMLILRQVRRLPQNYRAPIIIMLLAIVLTGFFAAAALFDWFPHSLDFSPFSAQVGQIMFYYALYNAHAMDVIFSSRSAVYEDAGHAILILSSEGNIMDHNKKTRDMAAHLSLPQLHALPFSRFIQSWMEASGGRTFEEDDTILTVEEDGAEVHYQLARSSIHRRGDGEVIGSYVEIKNITPMMSMIHMLQDSAYTDQLTGLLNRRSFVNKLAELNTAQQLPLGVVVGDVNRLKAVNDTYGHATGDLLLRATTEILLAASPENALWFRMGGDEFAGLVPRCTPAALTAEVDRRFAALSDERFAGTGIALAHRIKTRPEENITALLEEADAAMYADKWDRRQRRAP